MSYGLVSAEGGKTLAGIWLSESPAADEATYLQALLVRCQREGRITEQQSLRAYLTISNGDYRMVANRFDQNGGLFVMFSPWSAPGEQWEYPQAVVGTMNPLIQGVSVIDQLVRFRCLTCRGPVTLEVERIHPQAGASVYCVMCNTPYYLSPCTPEAVHVVTLFQVCRIHDLSEWYFANPVCVSAIKDRSRPEARFYALCSKCLFQFRSSVLNSFIIAHDVGGMIFNAHSEESARQFNALVKEECPQCQCDSVWIVVAE